MKISRRRLAFSVATVCFALSLGAEPALAKTHHHHRRHSVSHHHVSGAGTIISIAQKHLSYLGYYHGKIDGKMGPKTKAAIKKFQKDHALKADGVLGKKTNAALEAADPSAPSVQTFMTHEEVSSSDVVGSPAAPGGTSVSVNPDFATSMNGTTKSLNSRFATLEVSETGDGDRKRYDVNLNGTSLFYADGQPSVIQISPTYDLGDEDAVVFTTYNDKNPSCVYGSHLLVLNNLGYKTMDIANCTHHYEARVSNGSLFVIFTEPDDNRDVGSTWRLQGVTLLRL